MRGAGVESGDLADLGCVKDLGLEPVGDACVAFDEVCVRRVIGRGRLRPEREEELGPLRMLAAVRHARPQRLHVGKAVERLLVDLLRVPVVEHGGEQSVLASEVVDDQRRRRADRLRDHPQRAPAVAVLAEDEDRVLDEAAPRLDPGAVGASRTADHTGAQALS